MEWLPAVFGLVFFVIGFYIGRWYQRHKGEDLLKAAGTSWEELREKYKK